MASRSMFADGFKERRDLEQYFWTPSTTELLLTRFDYLPGFHYFDLRTPMSSACAGWTMSRIVVFDPPFFYIPLSLLYQAVLEITGGSPDTKLLVGFLKREEAALLKTFAAFKLQPTKFLLEYQTVKPNKWTNYTLYSNVDLPGIKRIKSSRT